MGGGRRVEEKAIYPYDYFVILVLKQRQLGTEHVHCVLVFNGVTYKKALLDHLQNYCFAVNSLQQIVIAKVFNEHVLSVIKFKDRSVKLRSTKMFVRKDNYHYLPIPYFVL